MSGVSPRLFNLWVAFGVQLECRRTSKFVGTYYKGALNTIPGGSSLLRKPLWATSMMHASTTGTWRCLDRRLYLDHAHGSCACALRMYASFSCPLWDTPCENLPPPESGSPFFLLPRSEVVQLLSEWFRQIVGSQLVRLSLLHVFVIGCRHTICSTSGSWEGTSYRAHHVAMFMWIRYLVN